MGSMKSVTCCHNPSMGSEFCHCEQCVTVDRQCINSEHYQQGPSPAALGPAWWGFRASCELCALFRHRNKDQGLEENLDRMELSVLMTWVAALFM